MGPLLLTESVELTFPDETNAQIVWVIVFAVIIGVYLIVSRTRRRAKEHYLASKRREADLKANDPDMKKD